MVLVFLVPEVGWGQNVNATWGANANSAWYNGGNWVGGFYAGVQGAAVSNGNVATFTSAYTAFTAGINMGPGNLNLGAISIDNTRTIDLNIGNSSGTTGVLRFYGSTVNAVSNVIVRNNSTGLFTLQAAQNGLMGVVLSNPIDNVINIDNTGGVTISSILSGTGKLTKAGSGPGVLILAGVNTYSGGTTITAGTLTLGSATTLDDAGAITINGGTFNTGSGFGETAGTLALTANSSIALGAAIHTLSFSNPSGTYSGVLTITGWTGSPGVTGTAGKIKIGNTSTSLTAAQKAQIQFTGYAQGAVLQLADGEVVPVGSVTLDHTGLAQTTASNIIVGSVDNILSNFRTNVTGGPVTLNSISFTVGGTFSAGDITNFNLYTSTTATFPGGAALSTLAAGAIGTGGTVSFTGLTQSCTVATPRYFWITADVAAGGTPGNTVIVPAAPTVNFAAGVVTNSISVGGTKTIIANSVTLSPLTQANGAYCNLNSNSISLTYNFTGTVTAPFIELSNSTGSFASGTTNLGGTISGSGPYTITGTIPAALGAGTLYRVRIKSTDAIPVISPDNSSNIIIYAQPTVAAIAGGATQVCAGLTTAAFTNATAGGTWSVVNGTGSATITTGGVVTAVTSGTVSVVYTVTNGTCTNSATAALTIDALPANPTGSISTSANPSCGPATLIFASGTSPILNYWQTGSTGILTTSPTSSNYSLTATGTTYVRTQNTTTGCWSSGTINTGVVTIMTSPSISLQPTNATTNTAAVSTFTLTAANNSGYQWQVDDGTGWVNVTNNTIYSGATTATLTITSPPKICDGNDYRCIVKANSPCIDLLSNSVNLTVNQGPCILEGFETGLTGSYTTGNVNLGSGTWNLTRVLGGNSGTAHSGSTSCQLESSTGSQITSPVTAAGGINTVTFWAKSSTATGSLQVNYRISSGAWIAATGSPFAVTSTYQQFTATINNTSNNIEFQIYRTSSTLYIDDIEVYCPTSVCTSTATITDIKPMTAPVGALVTITGTGFTGATAVKFGTTNATSFTVVSTTKIIAKVPTNVPTDYITVTPNGSTCVAKASVIFTPISATGCGTNGSGSTVNDISISEVYDAVSGSLSYIEIFNGTGSTVTLGSPNNYVVRIRTGTSTDNDFPLTGTLASGAVTIVLIGNSSSSCTLSPSLINVNQPSASGFNGNDRIYLRKGGVDIDYVPNPNYSGGSLPGFSQLRNATTSAATIPSTTYTASDWNIKTTEDCSNLGIPPYIVGGTTVTISSQPSDINCTALTFTVGATSTPSPVGNYLWYYNDPSSMSGWLAASGLTNVSNGITASNTNTASMSVTGNTAALYNYQFYAEVSKNSCKNYSNAAQFTYSTRPIYASNVATGNWTTPGSWLMSYDNITFVSTCNYPVSSNSSEVIVKNGHTITLPINVDIDKITVQSTGKLILNSTALLTVYDSTAGADLIVNGILEDNGSIGNGLSLGTGATWQIGAAGTLVKTNLSSSAVYRDNYETGIVNIPATANWIYRNVGTNISFTSANITTPMYYPNLTLENTLAGIYASNIINATPSLSTFTMLGASNANTNTIKGNFNVGGAGPGNIYFASIDQTHLVNILGNLTIRAGSTLINGNKSIQGMGFDLKGDLTLDGALSLHENRIGLLRFSGTANQNITGAALTSKDTLWDVTIANNGNTLNLNKNIGVLNALTFESAAKINLNSSYLNLRSVDTVTARVATMPANATISYGTGRFVVERYYQGRRGWRLVTAPVTVDNNKTFFKSWQIGGGTTYGEGTFISSPIAPAGGFDVSPLQNYSLQLYDGTKLVGIGNTNVNTISNTAGAVGVPDNYGMFLFVRGDRSTNNLFYPPNNNNTVLRDTGKIQLGNQTFSFTNGVNKYSLLGNPYPSPVNINGALNLSTNVNKDLFYLWDPFLNSAQGAYLTFTRGGPSSPWISAPLSPSKMDTTLQSSQAFYVQHTGINATMTFTEAFKVPTTLAKNIKFRPQGTNQISNFRTNLYLLESNGSSILADGVYNEFKDDYSDTLDNFDAIKFMNTNENLGLKRYGSILAVERRVPIIAEDTIFYNLVRFTPRSYRLEFEPNNLDPLLIGILEDKFTGTKTPVDLLQRSTFDFIVTIDAASYADDRFRIVFKPAATGPLPVTFTNINAYEKVKNIAVEWTVENEINIREYEVEKSTDGINFTKANTTAATGTNSSTTTYSWLDVHPAVGDNYFRIISVDQNGKRAFSRIVKVKIGKLKAGLAIYSNPVIGNTIGVQFSDMPVGKYKARLLNNLGQVLLIQSIEYAGGNSIQNITPSNTLAKGIYQLEIINPDKTKTSLKVIK